MRILFFGTPQIAVPYLEWLQKNETVVGVVCRADKPAGRGYELTLPPTKIFAQEKNLPIFQPTGPWTPETIQPLKNLGADVGVVVAYGRILPREVFASPRLASFNIHFSLLPKYRGAAPIQWSLMNGEQETGASAFWLEEGLDSGPLCGQEKIRIEPMDNAVTLREKLVPAGLRVLEKVLGDLRQEKIIREPQEGAVVLAPPLKKEDGKIAWTKPAQAIVNLIRGTFEWPGAVTTYTSADGSRKQLKILKARAEYPDEPMGPAGRILDAKSGQGIVVAAGTGYVLVEEVQPEGKKPMSAWAFWQGARLAVGDSF